MALLDACIKGDLKAVKTLLKNDIEEKNVYHYTPLLLASYNEYVEIVKVLLAHGANVDATTISKQSSLHIASRKGNTEIVKALLAHGANVNVTDGYGETPLHDACRFDHEETALLLLKHGADRYVVNNRGKTPIDLARKDLKRTVEDFHDPLEIKEPCCE